MAREMSERPELALINSEAGLANAQAGDVEAVAEGEQRMRRITSTVASCT